jgi:hypothetical protein
MPTIAFSRGPCLRSLTTPAWSVLKRDFGQHERHRALMDAGPAAICIWMDHWRSANLGERDGRLNGNHEPCREEFRFLARRRCWCAVLLLLSWSFRYCTRIFCGCGSWSGCTAISRHPPQVHNFAGVCHWPYRSTASAHTDLFQQAIHLGVMSMLPHLSLLPTCSSYAGWPVYRQR